MMCLNSALVYLLLNNILYAHNANRLHPLTIISYHDRLNLRTERPCLEMYLVREIRRRRCPSIDDTYVIIIIFLSDSQITCSSAAQFSRRRRRFWMCFHAGQQQVYTGSSYLRCVIIRSPRRYRFLHQRFDGQRAAINVFRSVVSDFVRHAHTPLQYNIVILQFLILLPHRSQVLFETS